MTDGLLGKQGGLQPHLSRPHHNQNHALVAAIAAPVKPLVEQAGAAPVRCKQVRSSDGSSSKRHTACSVSSSVPHGGSSTTLDNKPNHQRRGDAADGHMPRYQHDPARQHHQLQPQHRLMFRYGYVHLVLIH